MVQMEITWLLDFLAGDVSMFLQSSASARDVIDNAPFEVGIAFFHILKIRNVKGL